MSSLSLFWCAQKQKKLVGMVHEICSEISHSMGKLVQGIGKLDDDGGTTSVPAADNVGGPSSEHSRERRDAGVNDPHTLPSDEESYQSGSDTYDEHDDDRKDQTVVKATPTAMETMVTATLMERPTVAAMMPRARSVSKKKQDKRK